ncbi:hypothetical protein MU582_01880 [Nocardioidaceae bacterium SCSIO 66511]|nr:hypothetical protein MU582_01880 [Nocardioidaceae bacterium SCSIO 66511]
MRRYLVGSAVACASVVMAGMANTSSAEPGFADTDPYAPQGTMRERAKPVTAVPGDRARASTPWRGAAWTDPGEAAANARDIRKVDAYVNRKTGVVKAITTFQAAPTKKGTAIALYVGAVDENGMCLARTVVVVPTRGGKGFWAHLKANGTPGKGGTARSDRDTKRVIATASAAGLKGVPAGCAYAVASAHSGQPVYDRTGYVRLDQWDPMLRYDGGTSLHTGFVVGSKKSLKVRIKNNPDTVTPTPVRGVRVFIRPAKGIAAASRSTSLGMLDFYDEKTATFKIRPKKRKAGTVKWTAVGDYGIASGSYRLHPLAKPLKIGKSLAGKRFWAPHKNLQWRAYGIWFVNRKFAYVGFPPKGKPTCKKVTSGGEKRGCVRYKFRPGKNKLTIAGKRAKVKNGRISWRGRSYRPLSVPKAGSRWTVSHRHVNATTSGTLEYLDILLNGNGRFATYRTVFARSGPSTRAGGDLPEGRGTYRIKKHGHLVLKYRSGKVVHRSLGVLTNGSRRPNPWDTGLMIGKTYYDR